MPALLTIDEARARVGAATTPLGPESVAIADALGRTLAEAVTAAGDTPPFPCSAMDGYALQAGPAGRVLAVAGESRAGIPSDIALETGTAMRISTGAAMPAGATAVIRQEDVERLDGGVRLLADAAPGENVRRAGEDMRAGALVLNAGCRLGAAEIGAAVAAGTGAVVVGRRPVVSVLSTGDELREPGEPLGPGQIHNSNGPMLTALAQRAGARARAHTRLPDDRRATVAGLRAALDASDVVLIAGGVSVGPHDHVKPALAELGVQESFWGVALQPGKPTWFGTRERTLVFGLPGNPVSAYVTFTLFGRPALQALQGAASEPRRRRAALAVPVAQNSAREQALRVRLRDDGTALSAEPNGPQGSHIVTSLVGADALALIPRGEAGLAAGTTVELIDLDG